jgi:hypothetical protein
LRRAKKSVAARKNKRCGAQKKALRHAKISVAARKNKRCGAQKKALRRIKKKTPKEFFLNYNYNYN